jgi:hypothetical protein
MRTKLRTTLSIAALIAVLAGCGGGGATPAAGTATAGSPTGEPATTDDTGGGEATPEAASGGAGSVDVCALLTTDQVKQVTGADTTAGLESTSGWADWVAGECWWNSKDMLVRFSVDVGTPDSIAKSSSPTAKEQLDISKLAYKAFGDVEDLSIGDGAIYVGGFVVAIKGGSMMELTAIGMDKAKAIEIAKLVVAKL